MDRFSTLWNPRAMNKDRLPAKDDIFLLYKEMKPYGCNLIYCKRALYLAEGNIAEARDILRLGYGFT